jgi:sugar-specific transcriptional regulator TrmB
LSLEQIVKILSGLGLTRLDSKIYIHLVKNGPTKGNEISKSLKIQKQQLHLSLKKLQTKGIINSTFENPAKFSAVTVTEVFEIFIKSKLTQAQSIEENKNEILANC